MNNTNGEQTAQAEERAHLELLIAVYSRRDGMYIGINRLCRDLVDKLKSILEDAQARLAKDLTEFESHINNIPKVVQETTVKIALTKKLPREDIHFCCQELKDAASIEGEAEIALALQEYEADIYGERWYARCPYCKALLVLNSSGLFPTWRDEV
jgi:hypothetical protein